MDDGQILRALAVLTFLALITVGWWLVHRRRGSLRARPASITLADLDLPGLRPDQDAAPRLTLVQFSAPVCGPCRLSMQRWRALSDQDDGVHLAEVQAEDHLDLLARLGVHTTPTTAVFDDRGRLTGTITGPPSPAQVRDLHHASADAGGGGSVGGAGGPGSAAHSGNSAHLVHAGNSAHPASRR